MTSREFTDTARAVDEQLTYPGARSWLYYQLGVSEALHRNVEDQGNLVRRGPMAMTKGGALFQMSFVSTGPQHAENPSAEELQELGQPKFLVLGAPLGEELQPLEVGFSVRRFTWHSLYVAAPVERAVRSTRMSGVEVMREAEGAARVGMSALDALHQGSYFMLNLQDLPPNVPPVAASEPLHILNDTWQFPYIH